MQTPKNYYEILGVKPESAPDEIKCAYRSLARLYHPDVNKSEDAEKKFREINEAFEILSNPDKRSYYDFARKNNLKFDVNSTFSFPSLQDLFKFFFGGKEEKKEQKEDVQVTVYLTLEEACTGTTKTVHFKAQVRCPSCRGIGIKQGQTCPDCQGLGFVRRLQKMEVKIPDGVQEDTKVRVPREGNFYGLGQTTDLRLKIRIKEHPLYTVKEADLYCVIPITVTEAVLGTQIKLPHPSGKTILVNVPPRMTEERFLRIPGQGIPSPADKGNLYLKLKLAMPDVLTRKEQELYEELHRISKENPRQYLESFFRERSDVP